MIDLPFTHPEYPYFGSVVSVEFYLSVAPQETDKVALKNSLHLVVA